jgi:hypothetical protein
MSLALDIHIRIIELLGRKKLPDFGKPQKSNIVKRQKERDRETERGRELERERQRKREWKREIEIVWKCEWERKKER